MEIIAFYLPQFHPTPHNNEWWGKGFTEWTNVAKAKPLFKGHYQPKIPADLGFYDLRMPDIREEQAKLAREAGVTGFCYYHYWFGNGHKELNLPFEEVISMGKPDFPFCLCWANESWHKKFCNKDGTMALKSKVLVEQKYLGSLDNENHFYELLPAFKDQRYMKINGCPIFVIYKPLSFINMSGFISEWNKLAKMNGFAGIHFIGYSLDVKNEYDKIKGLGFNAVNSCRIGYGKHNYIIRVIYKLFSVFFQIPRIFSYEKMIKNFIGDEEAIEDVYPTIIPNWDHTPRSGNRGYLYHNSTPALFKKHVEVVLNHINHKKNKIVFLKSWNEWGEGNYMEPDLRYGKGYIHALKDAILKCSDKDVIGK